MNINRYINFARLLTLNYKKIGLSDDEYVLLSITYELVQTGTKFVNPSDLALLCNFSTTKIDVVYSGLISKNLISNEFSPSGSIYTSFDGITKKLLECLVVFFINCKIHFICKPNSSKNSCWVLFNSFIWITNESYNKTKQIFYTIIRINHIKISRI